VVVGSRIRAVSLAVLVGLIACAGAPPATLRTGVGALSPAWTRISAGGASIALHHADGGVIAANVACDRSDEDAPLDVLVNHLLFQLEAPVERGRERIVLDGRAATRARISVRLDGVPVELELVVLKKDGCVVDAQLVADARRLAARQADFDRFVTGLAISRSQR